MNFLKEIRHHLKDFETESNDEIHKFIDFLETKYIAPHPPVVAPPVDNQVTLPPTFIAPVAATVEAPVQAPVEATVEAPVATTEVATLTTADVATLTTTDVQTIQPTEATNG